MNIWKVIGLILLGMLLVLWVQKCDHQEEIEKAKKMQVAALRTKPAEKKKRHTGCKPPKIVVKQEVNVIVVPAPQIREVPVVVPVETRVYQPVVIPAPIVAPVEFNRGCDNFPRRSYARGYGRDRFDRVPPGTHWSQRWRY